MISFRVNDFKYWYKSSNVISKYLKRNSTPYSCRFAKYIRIKQRVNISQSGEQTYFLSIIKMFVLAKIISS